MYHSSNLPILMAKFVIEGVREGVDKSHVVCPAPPCLPSPQTASIIKIKPSFPINPFSLSCSSPLNSRAHVSPSHNSIDVSNSVLSPAPVPFASPS